MPDINSTEDVFRMLDEQVQTISWDHFYEERRQPAPFLVHPDLPDENLVRFLREVNDKPKTALEFGCGEGRNALYMAQNGVSVTALDMSSVAIQNAADHADKAGLTVQFQCGNVFDFSDLPQVDFIYDSGMFHHLAPHRRITYREMVWQNLNPHGYFALSCFAAGEDCADEVDDWEFYKTRQVGVAFSKERLLELFGKDFDVISIEKYRDGVPGTLQGIGFLWTCLFQKR